ncbi:MAG: xanthine dehydrogenase family protein molybdopterin-binding subunit [Caulobacterales bacterium]|nr:xanthine dehydrogenase family protein molybdopterin-binding subunit [Caulobacterales bacterium]
MSAQVFQKNFGQAVRRKEDARFVAGKGRYTDDITLAGQTHLVFVRSPYAHADITDIDIAEAAAAPGVLRVLTGADYKASGLGPCICGWPAVSKTGAPQKTGFHPPLAQGRVRYVGDHVVAVIAETRQQAVDAAELVQVDYEDLPVVTDVADAMREGVPQLHEDAPRNLSVDWAIGDKAATDAAFAGAAHVVSLDVRNNRLIPNAMEPRAANAQYNPGTDDFILYLSTQNPHGMKTLMSMAVGIAPEHKLRIIAPDVGGGFGSKAMNQPEEIICLWASKVVGRPVKWTADRSESFLCDVHGRDHVTKIELALDADHRFLAVRAHTVANMGAYLSTSGTLVPTFVSAPLLPGQYDVPVMYAEVDCVFTNTAPVDAYRGAGRPEAAYAIERIVDHAARTLRVDPGELRRKNFITSFPHATPGGLEYDIGDFPALLDQALQRVDYAGFAQRRAEAEARGDKRGIGISTYIEACGFGPSRVIRDWGGMGGAWESSEVRVLPTGFVEVYTGCLPHGQGHETVFAQYVSDRFGVPMENIELLWGDTDRGQYGAGTVGSRSGPVGLGALSSSCGKIIDKGKQIARHLLGVDLSEVEFEDGVFSARSTNKSLTFAEVAGAAYAGHHFPTDEIEPGLSATSTFDPSNFTFPAGCHICEIEIDGATGVPTIVNFVAVDDFGAVGNPMIVEGQVHGGLVQGIGQALLEHGVYDNEGQLVTGSYMDYCMPRADDVPFFEVGMHVTKSTANPIGMKGCGEAGAIGAPPAVINAIVNALDVDHVDMPATPEKLWRILHGRPPRA